MANNSIKNWAIDDQPREKMMLKGPSALSNAELLGILIGTGSRDQSAIDLAKSLMQLAQNDLNTLSRFGLAQMQAVKGIGIAKAVTLTAALELGRRRQKENALERLQFSDSQQVANFLIPLLQDYETEKFVVLYLNQANKLINHEIISHGSINATVVDIKLILRSAIQQLASKIILAHNHPSGNPKPSQADIQLTKKIKAAALLMDIDVLDHIIVAQHSYTSLNDEGLCS